ncbi:MAG: hypothetical protein HY708_07885 [Ignavibacteriae bacterium]|nr:hypothetical protein [Ignavibacteriota bacterium]
MSQTVNLDSPAVQSYLTILQGVIGRMASNSVGARTWCIALVSAIIVVIADKGEPRYVWIAVVPVGLFFLLDAYYLGLERQFRERYNDFIGKLHEGKAEVEDVFIVTPGGDLAGSMKATLVACGSVSVWPFYVLLALMLLVVRMWIL